MKIQLLNHSRRRTRFRGLLYSSFITVMLLTTVLHSKAYNATDFADWQLLQESEGMKFYYQLGDCNGQQMLYLRVVNESGQQAGSRWELNVEADQEKLQFIGMVDSIPHATDKAAMCSQPDLHLMIPITLNDTASLRVSINATVSFE